MEVYNIIEIANAHGGSVAYVKSLLKEFSSFKKDFGVKFQPLKPDEIALPDFYDYKAYETFFIPPKSWKEIISLAHQTKQVWLDIFDNYSVQILQENLPKIHGLKFQASVLNNYGLFKNLALVDVSNIIVMLNIASFELEKIGEVVSRVQSQLKPKEIVLQIGFQNFPTDFLDSGLSKIKVLQEKFPGYRIAFTDHIDANDEQSLYLPAVAPMLGVSIIEKHVRHSKLKTKYDFYSSIPVAKYKQYLEIQKKYHQAFNQPFINAREKLYLGKTLQIPIAKKPLRAGQLLNINEDLDFKRSNKKGLNIYQIKELVENFHILARDKKPQDTFTKKDFKKSKIAAIIACRLKSTRLPKKALLKIGDLASVELCLKHALQLQNVGQVVLATSDLPQDDELKNNTFSDKVIFHRGHPDDVIDRFLGIINKQHIDVVVRFGADIIYPCDEILQILLKSHFESGADYTAPSHHAHGTGMEIMSTGALRKLKEFFPSAKHSEYMTYYFTNNPSHVKLNFVDLPAHLVRDYRLTLDYQEDLDLCNKIDEYFKTNNVEYSIGLLFDFLDKHPDVAAINKHRSQIYKTDKKLAAFLKKETTIKK